MNVDWMSAAYRYLEAEAHREWVRQGRLMYKGWWIVPQWLHDAIRALNQNDERGFVAIRKSREGR